MKKYKSSEFILALMSADGCEVLDLIERLQEGIIIIERDDEISDKKKLITYKVDKTNDLSYGFADSVEDFLDSVQCFDEEYYILNVSDVSQDFYDKNMFKLKGI